MPPPFDTADILETAFADGLAVMLDAHRSLGVYILALANAAYDPALWKRLAPVLETRHAELAEQTTAALRHGDALDAPDDDAMVFLKLMAIGFDRLGRTESRRDGPWRAAFNPLRALRPPRVSGQRFERLLRPFDPDGFHFNKPFLAKEVLWSGQLEGRPVRLLYNKFPFARLHGLLVPEPERRLPQYLSAEQHRWAWALCAHGGVAGLCLGYNSAGAGASVNHLHFQSFVEADGLPVHDSRFEHNGGEQPYPLPCRRFDDAATAWMHIEALHRREQAYNLIYSRHALYCIARVPQDDPQLDARSRGYGWNEMAGAVTLFKRADHTAWTGADFAATLARFAP
jgi:hypothetical protein